MLFKHIDGFIVMSDQVEQELMLIKQDAIYKKLFHPIISKKNLHSKESAKKNLGISVSKIIMFFGLVRGYKGLDTLIKSNRHLANNLKDYRIFICG